MAVKKKKILAFGEVMLRIAMANYQTLEQTKEAKLNFTGTGLNVLSGLAHFGYKTSLLTQLPANRLGVAAKGEIRRLGVSDELIKENGNHMGIYLLEQGFGNRASEVTYLDRLHSSFGQSSWSEAELQHAVEGMDMVHICGISLTLNEQTKKAALLLAKVAKQQGKEVCFDFNFRPSIAGDQEMRLLRKSYEMMLELSDIVIGGSRDLIELLGVREYCHTNDLGELCDYVIEHYNLSVFAGTSRVVKDNQRFIKGFLSDKQGFCQSQQFPVYIYDRVGTGDAFAAGIIASYLERKNNEEMIEFATASAVLAHTTLGDSPVLSVNHVTQFLENPYSDIIR